MGPTKIVNFQYCGKVFLFCSLSNGKYISSYTRYIKPWLFISYCSEFYHISWVRARHSYWYEWSTYTVSDDNSDDDIDLGYEKNFHNELSHYHNESLYIPIVPNLSEESAISMISDEDAFNHFPQNSPACGRRYVLLVVLKVVQSGVHHTGGGDHDIVWPPFMLKGLNILPNFQKGGHDKISIFRGRFAGKDRVNFFRGCNFYIKNKQKSEIFIDKKTL